MLSWDGSFLFPGLFELGTIIFIVLANMAFQAEEQRRRELAEAEFGGGECASDIRAEVA